MKTRQILQQISDVIAEAAAELSPWIAPMPSAYAVYRATAVYLEFPKPVAFVAALAVELLGVSAIHSAMRDYHWNQTKTQKDARAPFELMAGIAVFYVIVTMLLSVVLETGLIDPSWAYPVFPLMTLCAGVVLAGNTQHRRRLEVKEGRKRKTSDRTVTGQRKQRKTSDRTEDAPFKGVNWNTASEDIKTAVRNIVTKHGENTTEAVKEIAQKMGGQTDGNMRKARRFVQYATEV